MEKPHREQDRLARHIIIIFSLALFLAIPCSVSLVEAVTPITSSGLNTAVSAPITLPTGQTQFNITGGTRSGGGPNLFHSFGDFNVPNNNIANFLNNSGLATSNILGRVTGGNVSNIFGSIQTTGFGNANLFLMNPAGFLFGPTATVNVGGMVTFTSADYLRLSDGVRFNAVPHTAPDQLLSAAPVAAFGFLGSNPGAITIQGSQLSVADGTGISLVGGNITVQAGTLTAPSGQINLVSVDKPSNSKVGGEVVVSGSGQGAGYIPIGFKSLGDVTLTQGSTVDASAIAGSGHPAGHVVIRGGELVVDGSSIEATFFSPDVRGVSGSIEVTAEKVALSSSTIDASTTGFITGPAGNIIFNVGTFSATDSAILATQGFFTGGGGPVTIQGLQGSGASAHSVSFTNSSISTSSRGLQSSPDNFNVDGGPIVVRADSIVLNHSGLNTHSDEGMGGTISLVTRGRLDISNSAFSTTSFDGSGGTVDLRAGAGISLTGTMIDAHSSSGLNGGNITMFAPRISITGSTLDAQSGGVGHGGTISITGEKAVSLTDGTVLSADNTVNPPFPFNPPNANGGTIYIDGGAKFTSQQSTISAQSALGNGGTIHIEAHKVGLTDTQVTTSVSGGPQTVGGNITVDANRVTLKNSEILSTATEGHGGTIDITTHKLSSNNSVIDASSQFGTDGTVTIQHP